MYNVKSQIAEEFINDSEIRETMAYARENSNNKELIKSILQKARANKLEFIDSLLECQFNVV